MSGLELLFVLDKESNGIEIGPGIGSDVGFGINVSVGG